MKDLKCSSQNKKNKQKNKLSKSYNALNKRSEHEEVTRGDILYTGDIFLQITKGPLGSHSNR